MAISEAVAEAIDARFPPGSVGAGKTHSDRRWGPGSGGDQVHVSRRFRAPASLCPAGAQRRTIAGMSVATEHDSTPTKVVMVSIVAALGGFLF
ncbi:MAG: hypothetical protein L0J58_00850, partial [Micrococcaceae bacterium]|nr:hypothetical protein [Micrococcaceae bacterium]